jgi:7-cyano-7-deazaguanine synthase
MAVLAKEAGLKQFPLFIDYGQRSRDREITACRHAFRSLDLPEPQIANLSGFGSLIRSGLTDSRLHVMEDAFTPGRNLLFLLMGAAHGYTVGAEEVAIGLLDEASIIFPDQTTDFLSGAESILSQSLGRDMKVVAPLRGFTKRDVVLLAQAKGIANTYSCHAGGERPCGVCIACREYHFKEI